MRQLTDEEAKALPPSDKDILIRKNKQVVESVDYMQEMEKEMLRHFRRLSMIQTMNAMSQGFVMKNPEVSKQENELAGKIIDSLKESNETLVDSLAEKQVESQEVAIKQTNANTQSDTIAYLVNFAKENPELVKEAIKQILPGEKATQN